MPEPLNRRLEDLYRRWHRSEYLGTDPLVLVREAAPEDREAVGFLVSCLALGRASLVVKAGRDVLARIGTPVAGRIASARPGAFDQALAGFVYRFFPAGRVAALVDALGRVLRDHGTLEAAWASTEVDGWDALGAFAGLFRSPGADLGVLVPTDDSAGAAKRLNLFLRWMVRRDEIDVGTWSVLRPRDLFMPIDTHVLQWARAEGLTDRKSADRKACLEITRALRTLSPDDPLKYDFSITREGMWMKNTLN